MKSLFFRALAMLFLASAMPALAQTADPAARPFDGAAAWASALSLKIAITYASERRQFDQGSGTDETVLLDYGKHQRRLLPRLATTYATIRCPRSASGTPTTATSRTSGCASSEVSISPAPIR